jgi:hypothetical protein
MDLANLSAGNLQDIAMGLLFLISGIGMIAYRSLTNNLELYNTSEWIQLGRPKLFGKKSLADGWHFYGYILSLKYRKNERRSIRTSGDVILGCLLAIWILMMCLFLFADWKRYEFDWRPTTQVVS